MCNNVLTVVVRETREQLLVVHELLSIGTFAEALEKRSTLL